jgi:hypothetical protein
MARLLLDERRDIFMPDVTNWRSRDENCDVCAVHSDMTTLIGAGLLNRTEDGIEFPYGAVHVDFILKAA